MSRTQKNLFGETVVDPANARLGPAVSPDQMKLWDKKAKPQIAQVPEKLDPTIIPEELTERWSLERGKWAKRQEKMGGTHYDPDFSKQLFRQCKQPGEALPFMNAWVSGWHRENAQTVVHEMEQEGFFV